MSATINAVIFDMDGVIFDSEKIYHDAFYRAAEQHGFAAEKDFVHGFVGKTTNSCLLILQDFFHNDADKTAEFFNDWGRARLAILAEDGLGFKAGFLDLFNVIKASGRPIGLVTSANHEDLRENFERNDPAMLKDFSHIITIEDVQYPKPNPQPYSMMIEKLAQLPEHCVVVEDSIPGANAAVAAGAKVIMINENQTPPPELKEKLWYLSDHHDNIRHFLQSNGL